LTRRKSRTEGIPGRDECLAILRNAGCSEDVVAHCEAVARVATRIAKRCRARMDVVEAGALLHDVGRARTHSIEHAVEGARLAREEGLPDEIVLIIERHIGAGILSGEASSLGLPEKDFMPETLEEKIVSHADNLISGNRRVAVEEAVANLIRRGLRDSATRTMRLHEELSRLAGVDVDRIA
jgi:tRNA (cytidine56-2'-O)-methyltransferase